MGEFIWKAQAVGGGMTEDGTYFSTFLGAVPLFELEEPGSKFSS